MHSYRSHNCCQLRNGDVGETVKLSGWVHRVRDHGGLLFIDLRDHYGVTQCVVDPDSSAFKLAESVRSEWVLCVEGEVKRRSDDTINENLPTGEVEIFIRELSVLGKADELPLPVFGEPEYPEETRLKYRFIDLRRETIHANIMKRSAIIRSIRKRMEESGFTDFQTPILTASSPEGARDYLVPSRLQPGHFYALPQAPQQFKQLLMVAGFDRYYQIAPCFRDEDPRADRLPGEFYQLDLEMSFVTQEDVLSTMEPIIREVFEEFSDGKRVTEKFQQIPYKEALRKYGTDKPDLRNPIELGDASQYFAGSGFKIFASMLESDPKAEVWAIPAKSGGSRAFCDQMNSWAQGEGQPGLGYIFFREEGGAINGAGPLAKNIGLERTESLRVEFGLEVGDAVFFVAGIPEKFMDFVGKARDKVGQELKLLDADQFALCWIVDFPMFEWDPEQKNYDFSHNPFSMPQGELASLNSKEPAEIDAFQYDIVCNGYEIGSGAIRNHRPEIMQRAFEIAGYSEEELNSRFGGMLRALEFGSPPHGGMAAGVDRIVMLLCGVENLREITLFPLNQQGYDPLMGAPSEVSTTQLRDLHIRLNLPAK